jgi:hypothetical protein
VPGAEQVHAINTSQGVGAASATALLAVSCVERGSSTAAWGQTKLEGNSTSKGTADESCTAANLGHCLLSLWSSCCTATPVLVIQDSKLLACVASYLTRDKAYSFDWSDHSLQKLFAGAAGVATPGHHEHHLLLLVLLLLVSPCGADTTHSGGGQLSEPVDETGSSTRGHVKSQAVQVSKRAGVGNYKIEHAIKEFCEAA